MSLIDFVLGRPEPDGAGGPVSGEEAFPRPIAFVEALKAAMRDHLLDITEDRALVPAHYTVLLHAEAYRYFEPAFPVITEAAGEELSKEADRISRIPYGAPLDGTGASGGPATPAPPPVCRDVRPVDTSWSVEFVPVLYSPDGEEVPPGYLAVATRLTAPEAPQVVADAEGGRGLSVTTMNPFSGAYESRPAAAATVQPVETGGATGSVTLRAPFSRPGEAGAPEPTPAPPPEADGSEAEPPAVEEPATEPLAALRYKYPGSPDEHVFAVTEPHVVIGRRTADNESVDLRLDVEVQVSAEHAHLRFDERAGRFEILDVSAFGTWVDEEPLTRSDPEGGVEHWHPLSDGATINLAGLLFLTFRSALA